MSCNCQNKAGSHAGAQFACTCDRFQHPLPLDIDAGLPELPRQIAGFPEFRRAMLFALRQKQALQGWSGTGHNDFGVMLLEMWAYICDVLSFYDHAIAQEAYLRSAKTRPSLQKLVSLLGYRPKPAVAATVLLAAFADGRLPVKLPKGTAFRSGGFNDNPPQIFELDSDTSIHPLANRWQVQQSGSGIVENSNPKFLFVRLQVELKEGQWLLLTDSHKSQYNQPARVHSTKLITGRDGEQYTRLEFQRALRLPQGLPLQRLKLWMPTQSAVARNPIIDAMFAPTMQFTNRVILDQYYPSIENGDFAIITCERDDARWFKLSELQKVNLTTTSRTIRVNNSTFSMPSIEREVNHVKLDVEINHESRKLHSRRNWIVDRSDKCRLLHDFVPVGAIMEEKTALFSSGDPLHLMNFEPLPGRSESGEFLLNDKDTRGLALRGRLESHTREIILDAGQSWSPALTHPVEVYGNLVRASQGESVEREILGSGDASRSFQTFKLKKKPLTYMLAPVSSDGQNARSTLVIHVNGVRWDEASSFFGKSPNDQVYILRQNEEEETLITFGDGIRGRRLPTGIDNVIASYRFGAGAAAPPAHALNQIAKPVAGLRSVTNPVAATGGADREPAEKIRVNAAKSALILGRAISIVDMEAVALSVPGVRAVQAAWRWHGVKQRSIVHIWYVGEEGIEEKVSAQLHSSTDPTTPIQVERATPVPVQMSLDIETDSRYIEADVLAEVRLIMLNPENGILIPEIVGIGRPLFRSRIFESVLSVKGVQAVRNVFFSRSPVLQPLNLLVAKRPLSFLATQPPLGRTAVLAPFSQIAVGGPLNPIPALAPLRRIAIPTSFSRDAVKAPSGRITLPTLLSQTTVQQSFNRFAYSPGVGRYFDFEHTGRLELNGVTSTQA